MYETFITEGTSADGVRALIGGFCLKGTRKEVISSYEKIRKRTLNQSKDIYLIDYILAQVVSEISSKNVVAVGATINLPNINLSTGGVIGSPFEDNNSADGLLEKINDDIYMVAAPGNLGIAYIGEEKMGREIEKYLMDGSKTQSESFKKVKEIADSYEVDYFIISDGCGDNSLGRVLVCESKRTQQLNLLL